MSNILLTGGRAPATLELARTFHRAGHAVFMAESLRGHLSEPSNALTANYLVPPPRQQTSAFLDALKTIIIENKIDLLIPTCEEVFYISMGRNQLLCKVFVEPINMLQMIHHKWAFIIQALNLGLPVPETLLIRSEDELLMAFAQWQKLVLKPIYSRFASRTLIRPTLKQALTTVTIDPDNPWIAQEFIDGQQFCTYSICHHGHITAHTAYRSDFTAGQGATIVFQHFEHPGIFDWVQRFVEATLFTGQIAFDFIESPDGEIVALECNPRATSGIHLLASDPKFVNAFFDESMDYITPSEKSSSMLTTAMLMYRLFPAIKNHKFNSWLSTFFSSPDVIFDTKDLLPFFLQWRSILHYLNLARKQHISPLAASTFDIEWNGEDIA